MAKPTKGMDAYDLERSIPSYDSEEVRPGAEAYFLDAEGKHRLIGAVYVDSDGDVVLAEAK